MSSYLKFMSMWVICQAPAGVHADSVLTALKAITGRPCWFSVYRDYFEVQCVKQSRISYWKSCTISDICMARRHIFGNYWTDVCNPINICCFFCLCDQSFNGISVSVSKHDSWQEIGQVRQEIVESQKVILLKFEENVNTKLGSLNERTLRTSAED